MADVLLDLARNPQARKFIKALGLPIPLPTPLERARGAWTATPLHDRSVGVGAAPGAELLTAIAASLAPAGAQPVLAADVAAAPFVEAGEPFGRPLIRADAYGDKAVHGLVFDASGISTIAGLRALHDFFQPAVERLARSGRVVVLGRAGAGASAEQSAARTALDGFVRSVAKELGRKGATANLVLVERGAEARLPAVLRFILSPRAAFVTGQPITVTSTARGAVEPAWQRPLEKKVVIVTGAARGIGEATVRLLAQEGAHVVCVDRPGDEGPLSQLARAVGGTAVAVDVTAADAGAALVAAVRPLGGVDVIIHNAGITRDKTLARMSADLWDQAIEVNLGAVVRTTAALEAVLRDGGRIICLSSVAGLAGNVGQANYAASKAGIVGFVRAEATRLAGKGITVNAIAPGFIETRLTAAIPLAIREAGRRLAALSQGGLPEDVGQALVFLASPGAQGITGTTLRVCGGSFIGA